MKTCRTTISFAALLAVGVAVLVPTVAEAIQPDAPFVQMAKRNAPKWAAENKQIDAKLAALQKRFGKRPNIIYILSDDVGWGELGWQGGGKHRGTPTPELDRLAHQGMRFWSAYAEPSCTPTRIAINTGRHPVRTGLLSVLWPGQNEGLSPEEVTVAEVLSEAGYHTATWGKWHLGELPQQAPENQGYDYAYYGLWNGAPYAWPDATKMYDGKTPAGSAMFFDFPGKEAYKSQAGIDLTHGFMAGRKGQNRKPAPHETSQAGLLEYEKECVRQMLAYIKEKAKSDRPFFIYWPTYTQQIAGDPDSLGKPFVDGQNNQASFMSMHNDHVRSILDTLEKQGIAENTLVVWFSDNGPMYGFWPTAGYTWLRGEKGKVEEGGVRVPAMAWWPGTIQPNQDPVDVIHVTDLFTTAARLGGATKFIPNDRVVDGIDQTALLLLGEGHGRRNFIFHYSGATLGAVRWEQFKVHILQGGGSLPPMEVYNVVRDPGEKFGGMYNYLFAVTPLQNLIKSHMGLIQKFPHRVSKTMPEGAEITPHD
jgi:arylsulfatase